MFLYPTGLRIALKYSDRLLVPSANSSFNVLILSSLSLYFFLVVGGAAQSSTFRLVKSVAACSSLSLVINSKMLGWHLPPTDCVNELCQPSTWFSLHEILALSVSVKVLKYKGPTLH